MKRKRSTKSKIYELIGRIVVYLSMFAVAEIGFILLMMYILENCITTIR